MLIEENEEKIIRALQQDLNKPSTEAFFEIIALRQELKVALNNLKQWIKPKQIAVPISLQPAEALIYPEPIGCVLIIGPWNYPFSLTLQPLISALAAGNTAILKPSEHAPKTSELIEELISKYFSDNVVQVIQGDGKAAEELLKNSFDHIFFTGGESIGKKVMSAASKHLTPVTLELGGKSPALVIQGANLEVTARRLVWGKSLNAGQTCIAPDHLLVEKKLYSTLISKMKNEVKSFYGEDPINSNNLAKIINENHFNRLTKLIEGAKHKQQIIFGGQFDSQNRCISPTLVKVEDRNDPLMQEEIFGPIMPILLIDNYKSAFNEMRQLPKPLAIYIFGGGEKEQKFAIENTSSGGLCFNDVVVQAGIPNLPFGGIGASGMGKYHGKAGFDTFTHKKSIVKKPFWMDIKFRYPPYKIDIAFLKKLLG